MELALTRFDVAPKSFDTPYHQVIMAPRLGSRLATVGLSLGLCVCFACGDSGYEPSGAGAGVGDGANGAGAGSAGSGGAQVTPSCDGTADPHQGEGTYYDADGSGNCSFPASPGDLMVAAMNDTDYAASAVCGACVTISGPNQSQVTVRIVDRCPECPQGDIDMSPEAFALLAEPELGRIAISWEYVPCAVSGPIVYHFKEGSNPFWTAVQIRNHAASIASVEAKDGSGNYVALDRADYNFFIAESGLGEGPYAFRVTDVLGEVLEDAAIPFVDSGDAPGAAQFAPCGPE